MWFKAVHDSIYKPKNKILKMICCPLVLNTVVFRNLKTSGWRMRNNNIKNSSLVVYILCIYM